MVVSGNGKAKDWLGQLDILGGYAFEDHSKFAAGKSFWQASDRVRMVRTLESSHLEVRSCADATARSRE
jgi:hypothetical protein